jgi:CheY-like chemotaxis protein
MSEDLLAFKMLVASEVGSDRDLLRQCAAKAAFPVDYAEIDAPLDVASIRGSLARDNLDFVFLDARIPKAECRTICEAEAQNGQSAVEEAGHRHFDLVLLDCNMPGLEGFATLFQLKRAHNELHVVMITGTRDTRLEDRARASGADDFLFKRFYANDVDRVLRRLFGLVAAKAG